MLECCINGNLCVSCCYARVVGNTAIKNGVSQEQVGKSFHEGNIDRSSTMRVLVW